MDKHLENEDGARVSRRTPLKSGVIAGTEAVGTRATANTVEATATNDHHNQSTTINIETGFGDAVANPKRAETGNKVTFADASDSVFDNESQTKHHFKHSHDRYSY